MQVIQVIVPYPINGTLSYSSREAVLSGTIVLVPLRNKLVLGIVTTVDEDMTAGQPAYSLKEIAAVLSLSPISSELLRFMQWLSKYYLIPLGMVGKMILGTLTTKNYTKIIDALKIEQPPNSCAATIPAAMVDNGVTLSREQESVFSQLMRDIEAGSAPQTYLLEGVTGSGKTEVYLAAASRIIANGGQVLILVPEILLSTQLYHRLKSYFGEIEVAAWHSDITPKTKREIWSKLQRNEIKVVIGARSALFLPFPSLGLIVIDEEHDTSYKQDSGGSYNARDAGIMRGFFEKIPVILVSATPSLEMMLAAKRGKCCHFVLSSRHGAAGLPNMMVLDMGKQLGNSKAGKKNMAWLHTSSAAALLETFQRGKQSLIFVNRRGYSPITFCTNCYNKPTCKQCSFSLVYHKKEQRLRCHHCGYTIPYLNYCNDCHHEGTLLSYGVGVEKISEDIAALIPEARVITLTSDSVGGRDRSREQLTAINNGDYDIIIGTQIIAKGLNFANLHLVLVPDADPSYIGMDFRVLEKTRQLLVQVAGRAGRYHEKGLVILQTHVPEHPLIQSLTTGKGFGELELQYREEAKMPPFTRLILITASSRSESDILSFFSVAKLPSHLLNSIDVLGPIPAPLAKLHGKYRYFLLFRGYRYDMKMQKVVRDWLIQLRAPKTIDLQVDVDPYNFS